jgi:hypothetical protein
MSNSSGDVCIISGCSRPARTRGLCKRCYDAAHTRVKAGEYTWQQLADMGLARASSREKGAADIWEAALKRAKIDEDTKANPSQRPGKAPDPPADVHGDRHGAPSPPAEQPDLRQTQAEGRGIRPAPEPDDQADQAPPIPPLDGAPLLPWQQPAR